MASSRIESLRRSLALRTQAFKDDQTPGLPDRKTPASKNKDDQDDDGDELAPRTCPKCDYVNQAKAKYCSECGRKLDKDDNSARVAATSRVLVRNAEAIDALNRQVAKLDRSAPYEPDLSIFSKRELRALGFGPRGNGFVNGEPGLLSPAEASRLLEVSEAAMAKAAKGARR